MDNAEDADRRLLKEARLVFPIVAKGDYHAALMAIASLRPAVDNFFAKVLVNSPDKSRRDQRLSLLHYLLENFSTIADFSEIITSGDQK